MIPPPPLPRDQQTQPLLLAYGRTGPLLQDRQGGEIPEVRGGHGAGADEDGLAAGAGLARQLDRGFGMRKKGTYGFVSEF